MIYDTGKYFSGLYPFSIGRINSISEPDLINSFWKILVT